MYTSAYSQLFLIYNERKEVIESWSRVLGYAARPYIPLLYGTDNGVKCNSIRTGQNVVFVTSFSLI